MKKRILSIAFVAVIVVTAGWNFAQSENKVNLSDLALTNVEALAGGEVEVGVVCAQVTSTWCQYIGGYGWLYGKPIWY